jgi:catechol 2,3-dioxygenase-like lactoylglutathione lyase family enzyme
MLRNANAFGSFSVDDIETARKFYDDTLGLDVSKSDMGLELDLAGFKYFLYRKPDHQAATFTVLNFKVENVAQTVAELSARGVRFEVFDNGELKTDANGIHHGTRDGEPTIAWFKDPAGNYLSVVERA